MTSPTTSQLLRSAPYFPVADLEQSVAHYERVLGFHREYVGGAPPQFAIMSRDSLPIMLRLVPASEHLSPNEKQGGTSCRKRIKWRSSRCAIAKAMCWGSGRRSRASGR